MKNRLKNFTLILLAACIPLMGIGQTTSLLFNDSNWSEQELTTEQSSRYSKIKALYPIENIQKIDIQDINTIQSNGSITLSIANDDCGEVTFFAKDVRYEDAAHYYWYGELRKPQNQASECYTGYLMLIKRGNEIFGTIKLANRTYLIEALSEAKNVLIKEPETSPQNLICGVDESETPPEDLTTDDLEGREAGNCDISVLFLYTNSVAQKLASPENRAAFILAITNQTLRNSQIYACDLEFTLAGVEEIADVDETGMDSEQVIDDLNYNSLEARDLREQFNADIVLLLIDPNIANFGTVAGRAVVGPNTNFPFGIFQASGTGIIPAHEIAHMLGCRHEPCTAINASNNCNPPPFLAPQQAHSFNMLGIESHTILFSSLSSNSILHYSNPDVSYLGTPTGIVDERNNARWIKEHACIVANFRDDGNLLTAVIRPVDGDGEGGNNEGCDGNPVFLYPEIDGGCPGSYTWTWHISTDGINYTHISNYDNMDLEWAYPDYVNDIDFVKLEATSACGEISLGFETLTAICGDGNWGLIAQNNPDIDIVSISPNPIQKDVLSFRFKLDKDVPVSFNILDAKGAIINTVNLGLLQKGEYKYSKKLNISGSNLYFLQLNKGDKVETIKFIQHD